MQNILPIMTYPNPILRKRAREVRIDELDGLQELIAQMKSTMIAAKGIGIAAPQINSGLRIIIVHYEDGPRAFINPQLSRKSFRKELGEEGCLSIPKVFGLVKRHHSLVVDALDEKGNVIHEKASGLFARVLQHEVDHIDGILFIDRSAKITQGKIPENK